MTVQISNGLGRVSLVLFSFGGLFLAVGCVAVAFEERARSPWLGLLPGLVLLGAVVLHKLTCWLIEGFSGKPVEPATSLKPLYLLSGIAVVAGLVASNWPVANSQSATLGPWTKYSSMSNDALFASVPPSATPSAGSTVLRPFSGTLDAPNAQPWKKDPIVQPSMPPETALEAASGEVIRAYPYLGTPQGVNVVKLIVAERDARIAQGERPEVALRGAAFMIAPMHLPRGAN